MENPNSPINYEAEVAKMFQDVPVVIGKTVDELEELIVNNQQQKVPCVSYRIKFDNGEN